MAGIITNLRFQQRAHDRVNIYLDGRFAFGLPALEAARLRVGQHLSDADIEQLQALDTGQKAYDRAVRFLGVRPRSRAEVRRHLGEAEISAPVIEAVLDRLAEQGYVDDASFARYWVENREQFRPKGPRALRQELHQRGLDGAVVDSALADLDQVASAYEAAQPRAGRLAGLAQADPQEFRRKLGNFLLRRGFDYGVVREIVRRLADELGAPEGDGTPSEDS